jgi:hypothetical protein
MPSLGWLFGIVYVSLYVVCIFTVCVMTFEKGRWILALLGVFLPILWLIGAWLPAKKGSDYELNQEIRYLRQT